MTSVLVGCPLLCLILIQYGLKHPFLLDPCWVCVVMHFQYRYTIIYAESYVVAAPKKTTKQTGVHQKLRGVMMHCEIVIYQCKTVRLCIMEVWLWLLWRMGILLIMPFNANVLETIKNRTNQHLTSTLFLPPSSTVIRKFCISLNIDIRFPWVKYPNIIRNRIVDQVLCIKSWAEWLLHS